MLPGLLTLAVLGAVVGGAIAAGVGPHAAQNACQYSSCATANPGVPTWVWGSIAAIIVAAIIAGLLIYRQDRRRRPPTGPTEDEAADEASGAVPAGAAGGMGPGGADDAAAGLAMGGAGAAAAGMAVGAGGLPEYVEGPEDVAAPAAVISQAVPARAVPPPAEADEGEAAPGEEPNIDDLMDELDRISGEILRKDAKPKGGKSGGSGTPAPASDAPPETDDTEK